MYAVSEGSIKINGKEIDTYGRAVLEAGTALHVIAGTSGYTGSRRRDAGGRTYARIECFCGDFFFDLIRDEDGKATGIEIACCGDDALDAIAKALGFAKQVIDEERFELDR